MTAPLLPNYESNRPARPPARATAKATGRAFSGEWFADITDEEAERQADEIGRKAQAARNRWQSLTAEERAPFMRVAVARYPDQTPRNQELYAIAELLQAMAKD